MDVVSGDNLTNEVFDNVPLVPPYKLEKIEINDNTRDLPGRMVMDEHGKYFKEYISYDGFTEYLIRAYDHWLDVLLPNMIKNKFEFRTNSANSVIRFDNIVFKPAGSLSDPRTHPRMMRMIDGTYKTEGYCDLLETFSDGTVNVKHNVFFGAIPVMIGSKRCVLHKLSPIERHRLGENKNDPNGYFIIKGRERIILLQDDLRLNRIFLYFGGNNQEELKCAMTVPSDFFGEQTIKLLYNEKWGTIHLYLNYFVNKSTKYQPESSIPILLAYAAFGLENINDIIQHILGFTESKNQSRIYTALSDCVQELNKYSTDLYSLIHRMKTGKGFTPETIVDDRKRIQSEFVNALFPNITENPSRKLAMLSMMVVRILEYKSGVGYLDDRDSWANKRVKTGAFYMQQLFDSFWYDSWKSIQKELDYKKSLSQEPLDIVSNYLHSSVSLISIYSDGFMTNWPLGKSVYKMNITDILRRDSNLATYAHLRRLGTQMDKKLSKGAPRLVHYSALDYICPVETPEGGGIGLIKNLSSICDITISLSDKNICSLVEPYVYTGRDTDNQITVILMLNGKYMGWVHGEVLYKYLTKCKISGKIYRDTCVNIFRNVLYVHTDAGRPVAPYLRVENNVLVLDKLRTDIERETGVVRVPPFHVLIENEAVEYIDAFEQGNILLTYSKEDLNNRSRLRDEQIDKINKDIEESTEEQLTRLYAERERLINLPKITHCSVDPSAFLSVAASIIPFANRSQAPRNTYQASMGKQALSLYSTNHRARMDTTSKVLAFPTRPLFEPQINDLLGMNEQPSGQTVMVAVMTFGGWDQEDAIIINQASLDAGLFMSTKYISHSSIKESGKEYVNGSTKKYKFHDKFAIPDDKTGKMDRDVYKHLGADGLPILNSFVKRGDCIIGKVRSFPEDNIDESIYLEIGEEGIIDRVTIVKNLSDHYVVHVKLRSVRKPIVGDKFASRYAQKATAGLRVKVVDMPFTVNGITPDIIINPLPLAGRMTINKVLEIVASKTMALKGEYMNATSFRAFDHNEFTKTLETYGYSFDGEEVMYDGKTGKKIQAKIYMGPCYYQALRHQVKDKVQARGDGPRKPKTGQPTTGRAKGGALRLGNMERDALIGHGGSALLMDRMMYSSDATEIHLCLQCGNIVNIDKGFKPQCKVCGSMNIGKTTTTSIFLRLRSLLTMANIKIDLMAEIPKHEETMNEEDVIHQLADELDLLSDEAAEKNKDDSDKEEESDNDESDLDIDEELDNLQIYDDEGDDNFDVDIDI